MMNICIYTVKVYWAHSYEDIVLDARDIAGSIIHTNLHSQRVYIIDDVNRK